MDHLGERLSALIDGELGAAEHERALIHLAKCESCRFEADMMRRLKRRLTGLGEPEPDLDFMGRLMASPGPAGPWDRPTGGGRGPGGPSGGSPFGSSPPLGSSRPLGGFPGGGPTMPGLDPGHSAQAPTEPGTDTVEAARTERERRGPRTGPERHVPSLQGEDSSVRPPYFSGGRYAVAGLAVATALLGSAFVAGGEGAENTPVVEPRLSDYAVEHAVTSRQIPVVDPGGPSVAAWPIGAPTPPLVAEPPSDPTETTR
ncbi:anti-sigma factor [Nocardiopsis sp. MG754419]|uniref:anti-sigma factor family protein n=1 Tax=Nocardiopsis sp. MG754419 TaxID=2259865 RepID=UPI001BA7E711|nr:zf-HC2 domain-containing protein [Nocardiopsis sp. MG754419]MBR8744820.1 zf-HC2 domain-containing protein [Nocardiopsis sp. MG754419]